MSFSFFRVASLAGVGFVAVLIAVNVVLTTAGLPTPSASPLTGELEAVFTELRGALSVTSALLPLAWLLGTIFAAGVTMACWMTGSFAARGWALVGFGGVLMQNVLFSGVSSSRLAVLRGAVEREPVGGLWGLHEAQFGFNLTFLACAVLGFTMAGIGAQLFARWQATVGIATAATLLFAASTSAFGASGLTGLSLVGLIGWLLWLVWILVFSVIVWRNATRLRSEGRAA